MVKAAVNIIIKPAPAREPAYSATPGTFRRGPNLMNGPGIKYPCANPTSTPLNTGFTAYL